MIRMTRIPVPDWASEHARGEARFYDGMMIQEYQAIQEHRERLLVIVHEEVERYIADHAFADCGDAYFPHLDRLNGEYYIGGETYGKHVGPFWYQVSFTIRCLQKPKSPLCAAPCDYLGLDVWLRCEPKTWDVTIYRNTDSSVI